MTSLRQARWASGVLMLGSAFAGCSSPHRDFDPNSGGASTEAGTGGTGLGPVAGGSGRAGNGAAGRVGVGGMGGGFASAGGSGESGAAGDVSDAGAGAGGGSAGAANDGCINDPCKNGATCVANGSAFSCTCLKGYSGTLCDGDIDDCASKPCQNAGTCVDGIASYACTCPHGFSGINCERVVHDCSDTPCLNGATCANDATSYLCTCKAGFSGNNCQTNIDDCTPNPCQNASACVDGTAQYSCTCKPGYSGSKCETNINDCSPNPCLNGSTCTDGVNAHTCACKAGYSGSNCETNINDCSPNPCQNGGTCTDGVNAHTCACKAGYSGSNCETNINDCSPNPCQNGGTCADGVNGYTCTCKGATGTKCELPRFSALGTNGVNAISADGKTIVGSTASNTPLPAFWTLAGGWKTLSVSPGNALVVNSDGSVISGFLEPGNGISGAFRYTAATGIVSMGLDTFSYPRGISSDGNVIFGTNGMQVPDLFRWTPSGAQLVGSLGHGVGACTDASGDGSIAVGRWDANGGGGSLPCKWTAATGLQTIGFSNGSADAISLDGNTIVGTYGDGGVWRYTTLGGQVSLSLGTLTATSVVAVSANGSIIAGNSSQGAWLYDLANGVRMVKTVLSGLGAATSNCDLSVAGMSSDGKVLAGNGPCGGNPINGWIGRLN